ncbi:MAG TPA: hypothetical protein VLH84_02435 [Patescibacteria group bacterium]|nr:hypothetical protein [Patescibacteria group bacterium]
MAQGELPAQASGLPPGLLSPEERDLDRFRPDPQEMALLARREAASLAIGAIADMWEVEVSVPHLLILAGDDEATRVRLGAKRALRAISAVASEDSEFMRLVGTPGIEPFVEGVLAYGAATPTYLGLVEKYGLSAEEATSFYELRRLVADEADGHIPGFPALIRTLRSIGISPRQAALDTDGALAALYEAGFFVDHAGGTTFDRPKFWPVDEDGERRPVAFTSSLSDWVPGGREQREWLLEQFEGRPGLTFEDE